MLKNHKQFYFGCEELSLRIIRRWVLKSLACVILLLSMLGILSYAQQQFIYDAKGKRNPFIPLVTPDGRLLNLEQEEVKKDLILEGIIYDKNGLSYAVVNGEIVKIGDRVDVYQVLKIEKEKIILIKEGEPLELHLKKEEE